MFPHETGKRKQCTQDPYPQVGEPKKRDNHTHRDSPQGRKGTKPHIRLPLLRGPALGTQALRCIALKTSGVLLLGDPEN